MMSFIKAILLVIWVISAGAGIVALLIPSIPLFVVGLATAIVVAALYATIVADGY